MSTDTKAPAGSRLKGPAPLLQSQTTAPETPSGSQELAAAVDDLLDQLQHKFDNVSTDIFGKLDDMSRRLDELEDSLTAKEDTVAKS